MEVQRFKLAALIAALISSTATAADIVIADVGVISMLEPGVQASRNVTVRGGKIVAIGQGEVTAGARVIDASGRYLIPGLAFSRRARRLSTGCRAPWGSRHSCGSRRTPVTTL